MSAMQLVPECVADGDYRGRLVALSIVAARMLVDVFQCRLATHCALR
jgi:hypothetical protein